EQAAHVVDRMARGQPVFDVRQNELHTAKAGAGIGCQRFFQVFVPCRYGIDGQLLPPHTPLHKRRYARATRRSSSASAASQGGFISPLIARTKCIACWRMAWIQGSWGVVTCGVTPSPG